MPPQVLPMKDHSRKLLFDEAPIAISPSAARLLGLPEAVFLQQLHYRLHMKSNDPETYKSHFIDGRYWVHWKMAELHREVPLGRSGDPYKRVVKSLRGLGILLVERHKQSSWNQTNHYSIVYETLDAVVEKRRQQYESSGGVATGPSEGAFRDEELDIDTSSGGDATNHCTETSSETSLNTTTTESGTDPSNLIWSDIPESVRPQILELVPQHLDKQRCIDMLSARIKRDAALPEEEKLASPVKWFKVVIANPDFSAADKFAEERQRRLDQQRTSRSAAEHSAASQMSQGNDQRDRERAAVERLSRLGSEERSALAAAAIVACEYQHFAAQITDAVSRGTLPDQRYARQAVLRALKKHGMEPRA